MMWQQLSSYILLVMRIWVLHLRCLIDSHGRYCTFLSLILYILYSYFEVTRMPWHNLGSQLSKVCIKILIYNAYRFLF